MSCHFLIVHLRSGSHALFCVFVGIAFPTSIGVNNCICHYSPLESEKEVTTLKDGDLVKM